MSMSGSKIGSTPSIDESGARLLAVLDTAVDAIITTSAEGKIESFNHAAELMFRCRAADVIGRNVSMLMPAQHASRHDQYMRDYGDQGTHRVIGRTREISAKRLDGTEFPIELALSGAQIAGKQLFTGIIRDISKRREAEAKLHEHHELLETLVSERTVALQATNRRLEKAKLKLQQANARLHQLARVDELTDVGNRRAFEERLGLEWRRQQREKKPLALMICDVDHFKQYNDHYGHQAGDECLVRIADALRSCFQRASEFVARYGGEEFAAIVPGADLDQATERAGAFLEKVRELRIDHAGRGAGQVVTISIGVTSTIPERATHSDELVEAADAALYRAKQNGRDRFEIATKL